MPNIEKIEATAIEIPLPRPVSGSTYTVLTRCTVITRIHADGLVSEVFNGDNRDSGPALCRLIEDLLQPLVVGMDVLAHERIWAAMFEASHTQRDRALIMEAIACVDTAVWDLKGKALGASVHQLMGGHRDRIPITSIGGYYQEGRTLDDLAREMQWLQSEGMAGVKFKVGALTPEEDFSRVEAARKAAGPDFIIGCDANRGWSVADAIRFARLVEPLDIAWFEEPCHWHDDVRMMAAVRDAIAIPVSAGQSEITSAAVRRLLDAGAVDIVNFDMSHGGGPTEWLRAAQLCQSVDVRMMHHEETHLAAHALAAVPHGLYLDCFADPDRDPIWAEMITNRPTIVDGCLEVPTGPGFDIELNWEMVAKYRVG